MANYAESLLCIVLNNSWIMEWVVLISRFCRTYALRRVRDAFRENRTVEDPKAVEELLNRARDSVALIQRQVLVQEIDVVTCGFCRVWWEISRDGSQPRTILCAWSPPPTSFGKDGKIWVFLKEVFFCSTRLHLLDQKYSKTFVSLYNKQTQINKYNSFLCEHIVNCNLFLWSKLYFQHHYSSLQCHMIFRNHFNMIKKLFWLSSMLKTSVLLNSIYLTCIASLLNNSINLYKKRTNLIDKWMDVCLDSS